MPTVSGHVRDLHQLVTYLAPGPVHLGVCSMGANVARDFALAFPTVWGVECRMGGHDRPTRAEAEMRREVCR